MARSVSSASTPLSHASAKGAAPVELVEQSMVKSHGAVEREDVLSSIRTALVSLYYTLFLAFRHYQASFAFFCATISAY
jgi:hypothetical protein